MSDSQNVATQTLGKLDDDTRLDLLTLANMLLHASYWFLSLSSCSTKLNLPGFAWATKEKEAKCKDAALMIFNMLREKDLTVELADVAKPRFEESDITSEFILGKWNDLDDWLEKKIKDIKEKANLRIVSNFLSNFLDSVTTTINAAK